MDNEIISILSTRYHTQQVEFDSFDADGIYKVTRHSLVGGLSFYLFIINCEQHASELMEKFETVLKSLSKPTSILCVLPYRQRLGQSDNEVMTLFNERYHSFIHFIYFDDKACKYSTDFYYYGSGEIKRVIRCVEQVLTKQMPTMFTPKAD